MPLPQLTTNQKKELDIIAEKYINIATNGFAPYSFKNLKLTFPHWLFLLENEDLEEIKLFFNEKKSYRLKSTCDITFCISHYDLHTVGKKIIPFEKRTESDYFHIQKFLDSNGIKDHDSQCLLWKNRKTTDGFGMTRKWGSSFIHRLAYQVYTRKTLPNDVYVYHTCNQKHCYSKEHLITYTNETKRKMKKRK